MPSIAGHPNEGLQRRYTYPRVEDAHYARKFDIRCREKDRSDHMVVCNTVDQFMQLTEQAFEKVRAGSNSPSLTTSVIGNSCRPADRRIAARASRKGPGERDDEASSHRGN